jgi:hypothetical protein
MAKDRGEAFSYNMAEADMKISNQKIPTAKSNGDFGEVICSRPSFLL